MLNPNPNISLSMTLDQFNSMQGILAKQPFDGVADMILGFRGQVEQQLSKLRETATRTPKPTGARRGRPRKVKVEEVQPKPTNGDGTEVFAT